MRPARVLLVLAALAALTLLIAPLLGMQRIPLTAVFGGGSDSMESTILWRLRVPRVLAAYLAGCTLALGGLAFQTVFRNPLATPFTLGVASGASLGAAIVLQLGLVGSLLGVPLVTIGAFCGAGLAISVVYGFTRIKQGFSSASMLLAGVAVSFFFSSVILFIQYTADVYNSFRILRWVMGGFGAVGYDAVLLLLPFTVLAAAVLWYYTHELNLLIIGDDLAISRGVDVVRTKRNLFVAVSLVVGAVVSVCGPIGFIGMMAPHMCRLMIGGDNRRLVWATLLFGGMFLVCCDTLARMVLAPAELPVGIITALLGGPFFIWLLLRGSGERRLGR